MFFPFSFHPDFPGRLKLLYYSPRVCQIPQQLQTHHPSLTLCLGGNKVSGFPGWQICVIVLRPGRGEQLGGRRRRAEEKKKGTRASGWQISLPLKVKIEFLWRGASQVVRVQDLFLLNPEKGESHPSGPCLNPMPYHGPADKKDSSTQAEGFLSCVCVAAGLCEVQRTPFHSALFYSTEQKWRDNRIIPIIDLLKLLLWQFLIFISLSSLKGKSPASLPRVVCFLQGDIQTLSLA